MKQRTMVWTAVLVGLVGVACRSQVDTTGLGQQSIEMPPTWPFEVGDTVDGDAWWDAEVRFGTGHSTSGSLRDYLDQMRELDIEVPERGVGVWTSFWIEDPDGDYACLVGYPYYDQMNVDHYYPEFGPDSAINIIFPPGVPCDPEARYDQRHVYMGHFR